MEWKLITFLHLKTKKKIIKQSQKIKGTIVSGKTGKKLMILKLKMEGAMFFFTKCCHS